MNVANENRFENVFSDDLKTQLLSGICLAHITS
jgi:hypothetical protein